MNDELIILKPPVRPSGRVHIARSFTFKLNIGNYQSIDFFCSQSNECSAEDADEISAALYHWCRNQVLAAVKEYKREMSEQAQRRVG